MFVSCRPRGAACAVKARAQSGRVTVPAGQIKDLTLHVELRRLQYWAAAGNRWETAAGSRMVYVGASSRDIRLQADANIAR